MIEDLLFVPKETLRFVENSISKVGNVARSVEGINVWKGKKDMPVEIYNDIIGICPDLLKMITGLIPLLGKRRQTADETRGIQVIYDKLDTLIAKLQIIDPMVKQCVVDVAEIPYEKIAPWIALITEFIGFCDDFVALLHSATSSKTSEELLDRVQKYEEEKKVRALKEQMRQDKRRAILDFFSSMKEEDCSKLFSDFQKKVREDPEIIFEDKKNVLVSLIGEEMEKKTE